MPLVGHITRILRFDYGAVVDMLIIILLALSYNAKIGQVAVSVMGTVPLGLSSTSTVTSVGHANGSIVLNVQLHFKVSW